MHISPYLISTNPFTHLIAIMAIVLICLTLYGCSLTPDSDEQDSRIETIVISNRTNFAACFGDRQGDDGWFPCFHPDESHSRHMVSLDRHAIMAQLKNYYDQDLYISQAQWLKIKCEYFKWAGEDIVCPDPPPGIYMSSREKVNFKNDTDDT